MTAERKEKLINEARIHYDWLRTRGMSLDDIEVTTREILRIWNIEVTCEESRLRLQAVHLLTAKKREQADRVRRDGNGPDDDASGAIVA